MLKFSTTSIAAYVLCAGLALGAHTAMAQVVPIANAGFEESVKSWETSQQAWRRTWIKIAKAASPLTSQL